MTSPTPRSQDDGIKVGPCGTPKGAPVATLLAGAKLRIEWDETVDHESHYRISFDDDGEDAFADPPEQRAFYSNGAVLLDDIEDVGGHLVADVTLPSVACERCTLQLIQVMYDKAPYAPGSGDIYYQCADLRLVADCAAAGGCDDLGPPQSQDPGGASGGPVTTPSSPDGSHEPATHADAGASDGDDTSASAPSTQSSGSSSYGSGYGAGQETSTAGAGPGDDASASGSACTAAPRGGAGTGATWLAGLGALLFARLLRSRRRAAASRASGRL
jgi:hypothetical protein